MAQTISLENVACGVCNNEKALVSREHDPLNLAIGGFIGVVFGPLLLATAAACYYLDFPGKINHYNCGSCGNSWDERVYSRKNKTGVKNE